MQHLVDALAPLTAKTFESQSRVQDETITRDRELAEVAGTGYVAHDKESSS